MPIPEPTLVNENTVAAILSEYNIHFMPKVNDQILQRDSRKLKLKTLTAAINSIIKRTQISQQNETK